MIEAEEKKKFQALLEYTTAEDQFFNRLTELLFDNQEELTNPVDFSREARTFFESVEEFRKEEFNRNESEETNLFI